MPVQVIVLVLFWHRDVIAVLALSAASKQNLFMPLQVIFWVLFWLCEIGSEMDFDLKAISDAGCAETVTLKGAALVLQNGSHLDHIKRSLLGNCLPKLAS